MIKFPFVGGAKEVNPEDMLYIQTEGHRNVFHIIEGKKEVQRSIYQKLEKLETVLLPYGFVRCHRSYVVNLRKVKSLSNYLMILETGEIFTIPRSRYRLVKEKFNEINDNHLVL